MALPTTTNPSASVSAALIDVPVTSTCHSHLPVNSRWRSGPPPFPPQMKTSHVGMCTTKTVTSPRECSSESARPPPCTSAKEPGKHQANALSVSVRDKASDLDATSTDASEVLENPSAASQHAVIVFELEATMLAHCLLRVCEEDRAPLLDEIATVSRVSRQTASAEYAAPLQLV